MTRLSKEERRRKREEQREQEVVATVGKLEFMEKRGVDIQVTPDGKVAAFVPGTRAPKGTAGWDAKVSTVYEDLQQMHKSERERDILLEAWERFQDEE
jgi:hypothetical protein